MLRDFQIWMYSKKFQFLVGHSAVIVYSQQKNPMWNLEYKLNEKSFIKKKTKSLTTPL